MCDSDGMSDQKILVYSVETHYTAPSRLHFKEWEDVLEIITLDCKDNDSDCDADYNIKRIYMYEHEYENLAEWEE